MNYNNFIAALDIGTSKITLTLATRTTSGTLNVIDVESCSTSSVKYGRIVNETNVARSIQSLILKIQQRLGAIIEQVYVTTSGTLLHTETRTAVKELGEGSIIQQATINSLMDKCKTAVTLNEDQEILSIESIEYKLDGEIANEIVGKPCNHIEGIYLITKSKSEDLNKIRNTLKIAEVRIAGIIASPEAIATATLTDREKEIGTAAIEIGHASTKVAIFHNSKLRFAATIPLGSNLITKDLSECLNIPETTAIQVKEDNTFGAVCSELVEDVDISLIEKNDIKNNHTSKSIVQVIEARVEEILANILFLIEQTKYTYLLSGGLVLSGGIVGLKNITHFIHLKSNFNTRIADTKRLFSESTSNEITSAYNAETAGMLTMGTDNCKKVDKKIERKEVPVVEEKIVEEKTKKTKKAGKSMDFLTKGMGSLFTGFFDETDEKID